MQRLAGDTELEMGNTSSEKRLNKIQHDQVIAYCNSLVSYGTNINVATCDNVQAWNEKQKK